MVATELAGVFSKIRAGSTQGKVYVAGVTECEDCACNEFEIGNFGGNEVAGTYLGMFDGFHRFQSTERSTGDQALTLITSGQDVCCRYIANVGVENTENIIAYYEIQCSNPRVEDSLESAWVAGTCVNYLACQTLSGVSTDPFIIDILFEQCTGSGGSTVSRYSEDYGVTFEAAQEIENGASAILGFDIAKVGTAVLAGATGQVRIANDGSAWSDYGDPLPTDFVPTSIWIPRYELGSTTVFNNGTSSPEYIVFSSIEDGDGETMYRVESGGTVFTPITPTISAVKGVAVGTDCIAMPFKSGAVIAAVADFGGDTHLITSDDTGATWDDRGQVADDALYIRFRRGDISLLQLFLANGTTDVTVSPSGGVNLIAKQSPTLTQLIGIEPFG